MTDVSITKSKCDFTFKALKRRFIFNQSCNYIFQEFNGIKQKRTGVK